MTDIAPEKVEFGPFTIEETRECFQAFDLDDNDFVGAGELRRVFQHLGEEVTDEEIDEMIRMCDQDGDGQVDEEEFCKMVFRHSGPPKASKRPRTDKLTDAEQLDILGKGKSGAEKAEVRVKILTAQERAERVMTLSNLAKQIDFVNKDMMAIQSKLTNQSDKNGRVDYKNFLDCVEETDSPMTKTLFELFNGKGEGKIDFREFLISLANVVAPSKEAKIEHAFSLFDIDGSGTIDIDELKKILKATHMEVSEAQVKQKADAIMRQADEDGSGEIDFKEFQTIANRFPNLIFPNFTKKR